MAARPESSNPPTAVEGRSVVRYVQVGKEINPGLLWPHGQTWDRDPDDDVVGAQWDNVAVFLKAGAVAAQKVDPDTEVILHLTNINNGIDSLT